MESALQTSRNVKLSHSSNTPSSQLSKSKHQDSTPWLISQESSSRTLYQADAHIMAWLQIGPCHLPSAKTSVRKERYSCAVPTLTLQVTPRITLLWENTSWIVLSKSDGEKIKSKYVPELEIIYKPFYMLISVENERETKEICHSGFLTVKLLHEQLQQNLP